MKQIAVYSLVVLMLILAGCPAKTMHSIDNGSYEVPSWLPGKWSEIDKDGVKQDTYLLKKDTKKGHLLCYEVDSAGKIDYLKPTPVILSSVAGKVFLCFYDKGENASEQGYYLFELRKVSNTEFVLAGLKEHTVEYETEPNDIVKYLQDNKNNESIFDPAETGHYKKQ